MRWVEIFRGFSRTNYMVYSRSTKFIIIGFIHRHSQYKKTINLTTLVRSQQTAVILDLVEMVRFWFIALHPWRMHICVHCLHCILIEMLGELNLVLRWTNQCFYFPNARWTCASSYILEFVSNKITLLGVWNVPFEFFIFIASWSVLLVLLLFLILKFPFISNQFPFSSLLERAHTHTLCLDLLLPRR